MKFCLVSVAAALLLFFLTVHAAHADYLGLAPGDYSVTLQGSSVFCSGTDCVGTVHIGSPGSTGFDWLFENIGDPANDFQFSAFTHLGTNGAVECAAESLTGFSLSNCTGLIDPPFLGLAYNSQTQGRLWSIVVGQTLLNGTWTVPAPVPEPLSGTLLLLGLGALGLQARMRRNLG